MADVPAVSLDALSVTLGSRSRRILALDQITATIPAGAITGLIGRNSAGKTTLLRVLAGHEPTFTGTAIVFGIPVARLGRTPGWVHLATPTWPHATDQSLSTLITALSRVRPAFDRARAHDLLDRFGVPATTSPRRLSQGQTTGAMAALALAARTPLTLLDEPHTGLDAPSRDLLTRLIIEEQDLRPRTWIISSHLIDESAPLFERVLVLDAGRLVAEAAVDDLLARYVRVEADAAALESLPRLGNLERLGDRASAIVPTVAVPAALASRTHPLTLQALAGVLPLDSKE